MNFVKDQVLKGFYEMDSSLSSPTMENFKGFYPMDLLHCKLYYMQHLFLKIHGVCVYASSHLPPPKKNNPELGVTASWLHMQQIDTKNKDDIYSSSVACVNKSIKKINFSF